MKYGKTILKQAELFLMWPIKWLVLQLNIPKANNQIDKIKWLLTGVVFLRELNYKGSLQ